VSTFNIVNWGHVSSHFPDSCDNILYLRVSMSSPSFKVLNYDCKNKESDKVGCLCVIIKNSCESYNP